MQKKYNPILKFSGQIFGTLAFFGVVPSRNQTLQWKRPSFTSMVFPCQCSFKRGFPAAMFDFWRVGTAWKRFRKVKANSEKNLGK
jgi:hypothetical protein